MDEISNEVLLRDIHNTELEADAYYNLSCGFWALARLPENELWKAAEYSNQHEKYQVLEQNCRLFLLKLYKLKKERGL